MPWEDRLFDGVDTDSYGHGPTSSLMSSVFSFGRRVENFFS